MIHFPFPGLLKLCLMCQCLSFSFNLVINSRNLIGLLPIPKPLLVCHPILILIQKFIISAPCLFCYHFAWPSSVSCPNAMAFHQTSSLTSIVNTASRIALLKYNIHFLDYQPWLPSTVPTIRSKSDWTPSSWIGVEPAFLWSSTMELFCGPYLHCIFLKILCNFLSLGLTFAFYYCCLTFLAFI